MKRNIFTLLILVLTSFVVFGQSQRMVLLEHFTQASCGPCAGVNPGLVALMQANPEKANYIMVHTSWPGTDPMYNHNPSDNGTRTSYYGVNSVPHSVLDGNFYSGHPNNWGLNDLEERYAVPSPFELQIHTELSPDEEVFYVNMLVHATEDVEAGLRAYMVVIEELVEFTSPPGSNGETEFTNVLKKILPGQTGYVLPAMNSGEYLIIQTSWEHQNVYDINELAAVGFIQENTSKEVFQSAKSSYSLFDPLYAVDADLTLVNNFSLYNCDGKIQPAVVIRNNGSTELTTAEIKYSINGGDPLVYQWTGNLSLLEKETVLLEESYFDIMGVNTLEVSIENPNGQTDEYDANNSRFIEIEEAIQAISPMKLLLKTDNNPGETTWEVINSSGEVIQEGGPYVNANQVHFETIEIASTDCYTFYLYDAGGDGLVGGQAILSDDNSNTVLYVSTFGSLAQTQFSVLFEGLAENVTSNTFELYPNPITETATLNFDLSNQSRVKYNLTDLLGQKVISKDLGVLPSGSQSFEIDMDSHEPGVYFINLNIEGEILTKKVILTR
jgi:hypothetical protein